MDLSNNASQLEALQRTAHKFKDKLEAEESRLLERKLSCHSNGPSCRSPLPCTLVKCVQLLTLIVQLIHFCDLCEARTATRQLSAVDDPRVLDASSLYAPAMQQAAGSSLWPTSLARHRRSVAGPPANRAEFVDACQSKMAVLTPYYATNNKGKLRTIVNSELMQQAIQVETCATRSFNAPPSSSSLAPGTKASKCNLQPGCGCEQKYKWHRLLAMDPKDVKGSGLFMDWFLFPSNCVCRCRNPLLVRHEINGH